MHSARLPLLALSLSLVAGAALGGITRRSPQTRSANENAEQEIKRASAALSATLGVSAPSESARQPNAAGDSTLPNASETQQFATLDLAQQQQMLERVSARFPNRRDTPPSLLLWIHRAVSQLSPDQAASLLEALSSNPQKDGAAESALASRLAALDPQRALDLGKKLANAKVTGAAIAALAQKDGAEALRTIAQLPKELRRNALDASRKEGFTRVGGSFEALAQTLKQNPDLVNSPESQWEIRSMLGNSLGQLALSDPKSALAQVRELSEALDTLPPPDGADRDGRGRGRRGGSPPMSSPISATLDSALSEMRAVSPQAASAFFDSLSEKEKSPWMASREAASRFSSAGIEAAVSFAEKQTNDEAMRSAALGTWWSLAEKDLATASAWIDSLPSGPFRQGVLTAVMLNAWNLSSSWGDTKTAIEAGQRLSSPNAQLDYFTNLLTDRHGSPRNIAEIFQELPLSEAEKIQLIQRVAPIKTETAPAKR